MNFSQITEFSLLQQVIVTITDYCFVPVSSQKLDFNYLIPTTTLEVKVFCAHFKNKECFKSINNVHTFRTMIIGTSRMQILVALIL